MEINQSMMWGACNLISLLIAMGCKQKAEMLLAHLQGENGIQALAQNIEHPDLLPTQLDRLMPEVVLLDGELLHLAGNEFLRMLKEKYPRIKVVFMFGQHHDGLLAEVSDLYFDGAIPANAAPHVYVKAIQAVARGEFWLPRGMISKAYRDLLQKVKLQPEAVTAPTPEMAACLSLLTKREKELFRLAAQGLANKEIARELNISIDTVKKHLKNIYAKCELNRRGQMASLLYKTHAEF